jgi:hypothetical protein
MMSTNDDVDRTTEPPVSGIYQIRNRHTGRVYIGKSRNIHGSWPAHRAALERRLHINDGLQGDWQIYGAAGGRGPAGACASRSRT